MRYLLLGMLMVLLGRLTLADEDDHSGQVDSMWLPLSECFLYYSQDTSHNIVFHNCTSSQSTSTRWNKCFRSCCSSSSAEKFPTPNTEALQYCEEFNQQEGGLLGLRIFLAVVAGTLLIMTCYCFFRSCCQKCWEKYNAPHHVQNVHHANHLHIVHRHRHLQFKEITTVQWEDEKEVNSRDGKGVIWSSGADVSRPLKATFQPCTICLEDNTTTELFCGHQYHPICIGEWLRKSTGCPCCRREDIRGIRIYCNLCRWRYFVCTRTYLSANSRRVPLRCELCLSVEVEIQNSRSELMVEASDKARPIKALQKEEQ